MEHSGLHVINPSLSNFLLVCDLYIKGKIQEQDTNIGDINLVYNWKLRQAVQVKSGPTEKLGCEWAARFHALPCAGMGLGPGTPAPAHAAAHPNPSVGSWERTE